jgi:hypothetical protein
VQLLQFIFAIGTIRMHVAQLVVPEANLPSTLAIGAEWTTARNSAFRAIHIPVRTASWTPFILCIFKKHIILQGHQYIILWELPFFLLTSKSSNQLYL